MFSYQLYSSRNFPPLSEVLVMLAKAGYQGVEGYGELYANSASLLHLAEALHTSGLVMPSGHFDLEQVEDSPNWVLTVAKTLGMQTVVVPWLEPHQRPKDARGWWELGTLLQAASAPLRAEGLNFAWHNHDFEFVKTPEGVIPQEALLEGGPGLKWEMDVAWVIKGGEDPLAWIAAHGHRLVAAHVKDIAPAGQNPDEEGWADVGHGTVDWKTILAALRAVGVSNFIMEHDNPSDDARFARRALVSVKSY